MRRAPLAVLCACALVLSGCAARFARSDGNDSTAVSQGGLPAEQTSTTGTTGTSGITVPRTDSSTTGGTGIVGTTGGPTTFGTSGGTASTTGTSGGSTSGSTTGTSSSGGTTGPSAVPAGSQTGVTKTTVKIGLFVPKTGAAPVPPTIDAQAQNYFDYVKSKGGIFGRNVSVKIYDTKSTEAGARTAVQNAVNDGIFAAVSLDRISVEGALVTALHNAHIPHLINQMPHAQAIPDDGFYIGTDQVNNGIQIADYMKDRLHYTKVGFVGENDPTAYPARNAFVAEAKRIGLTVVHNEVVDGMGNQFLAEAQKLKTDGAQAIWLYVAPNNAINISKESQADGYHPTWISSSIAWGFNLALTPAAGALDGARAFSPWGGLSDPRYATFNKVDTEGRTSQDKDIGLAAWGFGQVVAAALHAAGQDLGRNSFNVAMQNLRTGTKDVVTGAAMCWPALDFTGGKRYGSGDRTIVMAVKGSGASGSSVWTTESDYASKY